MFKLRIDDDQRVCMLPQDVIDNTVKAFSVSATSADRLRDAGRADGPVFRAGEWPGLRGDRSRRRRHVEHGDQGITDEFGVCGEGSLVVTGPLSRTST